MLQVNLGITTL